ncbi:uncharacterized protein isoform X1 [Salmo salar]|uniref:Uncharacterized protein LOC106602797 n=1 Tax=Salmo salar TaxID=8030 RepID=A0A1S3RFP9_SALSA|nr:uncharacterized protein LOC106602797 isoform X1 [Salmo salar]XP_014051128.1 uncharacterized protein LOC106602797 isoform X1 [Salmo salar]|eukprot:XP_014051127.1 PREDICTED: uncharacterized protein LOC106602797 [Salmo salar]
MVRSVREEGSQLSTIQDLKNSGFGRPPPRHGLKLLFWFANECVAFNHHGNMLVQCHPEMEEFGFHYFGNFEEILPVLSRDCRESYFEVGNLNTETYSKAEDLPDYVRKDYRLSLGYRQCNKDRIIIRLKQGDVTATYVTEHKEDGGRGEFDSERTHLINPDLIRIIQDPELELATFLDQTGYMGLSLRDRLLRAFKQISDVISWEPSEQSGPDQTTLDSLVRPTWDPEQDQTTSLLGLSLRERCTRVFVVIIVVLLVITLIVLVILGKF